MPFDIHRPIIGNLYHLQREIHENFDNKNEPHLTISVEVIYKDVFKRFCTKLLIRLVSQSLFTLSEILVDKQRPKVRTRVLNASKIRYPNI